jgi:hypothetical protein
LGYLHQKFFTSLIIAPPVLQPVNNIPASLQQLNPPEKPEIEQPAEIVPSLQPKVSTHDNNLQEELTHITDSITSEEQIHTLASINSLSIQEIEERARPAKHPTGPNKTVENNGMSFSGFLGVEESFKEVLLSDWKTVRALGWTHKDLAFHLGAISKLAEQSTYEGRYGNHAFNPEAEITYDYLGTGKAEQNLKVVFIVHRGFQEDIFAPVNDYWNSGWGRQCLITNVTTGASVMWTSGVQKYIRKYGFYEGGGKQNPYRVDPVALVSVLTGTPKAEQGDCMINYLTPSSRSL